MNDQSDRNGFASQVTAERHPNGDRFAYRSIAIHPVLGQAAKVANEQSKQGYELACTYQLRNTDITVGVFKYTGYALATYEEVAIDDEFGQVADVAHEQIEHGSELVGVCKLTDGNMQSGIFRRTGYTPAFE
jgi:hypothetical protein